MLLLDEFAPRGLSTQPEQTLQLQPRCVVRLLAAACVYTQMTHSATLGTHPFSGAACMRTVCVPNATHTPMKHTNPEQARPARHTHTHSKGSKGGSGGKGFPTASSMTLISIIPFVPKPQEKPAGSKRGPHTGGHMPRAASIACPGCCCERSHPLLNRKKPTPSLLRHGGERGKREKDTRSHQCAREQGTRQLSHIPDRSRRAQHKSRCVGTRARVCAWCLKPKPKGPRALPDPTCHMPSPWQHNNPSGALWLSQSKQQLVSWLLRSAAVGRASTVSA
jgi:hypothetical protein